MSSYVNNLTSADPIHALRYAVSYDKFLNNDEKIFKLRPLKWSLGKLGSKKYIYFWAVWLVQKKLKYVQFTLSLFVSLL